jgi:hypothetical protein
MDAERRRLSLSLKRVEDGESIRSPLGEGAPELGLSEEVFSEGETAEPEAQDQEEEPAVAADELAADEEAPAEPGAGDSEGEIPAAPDDDER